MSSSGNWRSVSIHMLSYGSQRRIAACLDAPNTLNWKYLLTMMPEYGYVRKRDYFNTAFIGDINMLKKL